MMAGNWKMYKTPAETHAFFETFKPLVADAKHCDIVICPPFPDLHAAIKEAEGSNVAIGAQNLYWGREGAVTGEVSGHMLQAIQCKYVIIAHSERRQYFGETEADVVRKTQAALEFGLRPIVCVGERLEERESGRTEDVLAEQFDGGIAPLSAEDFAKIVIAYEPVWAIGTGRTATPAQAEEVCVHIVTRLDQLLGEVASSVPVLYGGSVTADNAAELFGQAHIHGALVGGASLKVDTFTAIVRAAEVAAAAAEQR
jgi:triosephosphate isomerase